MANPRSPSGSSRKPDRPPAPAADSVIDPASTEPVRDVWSRSGSKHRRRAIVLLLVNVLLFAGVGSFAFWLRTGQHFAPAVDNYWSMFGKTFQPMGEERITLSDFLTFPISIYQVPLQIVILGLLLAALVSIPILVSILYRFFACIPFLLVVAFLAVMPWLAITLAGSCLLASVRPFRFSFRFASALFGLVLVIIYFYSASRQSASAVQEVLVPADRIKFMAPWVLAIIASCLMFAIVLLIAKAVNYRPGAIAPLLAVFFSLPVALFEVYVGRDELHYRLLEHAYGPGTSYFTDQDVSKEFEDALYARWRLHPDPKPPYDALSAHQELWWQLELGVESDRRTLFAEHRQAAVDACEEFLFSFPLSRYACNALYIKAKALDTRVDLPAFRTKKELRFYDSFPSPASRHPWEKLVANRPDSPMAAVGLLRLAQLDARARDVTGALEHLRTLVERFGNSETPTTQSGRERGGLNQILPTVSPESSLAVPAESIVFEARRLLGMLQANRDPLYGYDPLCGPQEPREGDPFGLLQLDPRHAQYVTNLEALLQRYPDCQLADNIELEIAKAAPDLQTRFASFQACVDHHPTGDALPEALFRLGVAWQELERPREARGAFQRVLSEFGDSIWAAPAAARLRLLPVTLEGEGK